ncbi:hypothetical protein [uncultured Amnibacterium sp.]|uniref:hypothetical protein n=1 Tax=uncultured Amnibacterium sp. TaxID=1631851 RepID=UPI0035CB07E1
MIALPRRFILIMGWVSMTFVVTFAIVQIRTQTVPGPSIAALVLFAGVFLLLFVDRDPDRLPRWKAALGTVAGAAVPVLGTVAVDPLRDSYDSGGWSVRAAGCMVVVLYWRRREPLAWLLTAALVAHTMLWAGPGGLDRFSVSRTVLLVAVLAGGGWALQRTTRDMQRSSAAERREIEYLAAQDAYHAERQLRFVTTGRLAAPMLQRIADARGRLDPADRAECRVLEETIRDEIRGRRLLNDVLRDRIMALRRRGSIVQVNDDGGIDDLEPAVVDPMLTRVAEAIAPLTSDRIVIRTSAADSPSALTVVATSSDPIAAALGLDDGDDRVDLWLEIDRPVGTPSG